MIKPTIGRVVWYAPAVSERFQGDDGSQRWAALVTNVWSDTCVNLAVFDPNGVASNRTSVLLVQEGSPTPGASFCEWMPYQKGQAAKTDALEIAAAARAAGPTGY